MLDYKTLNKIPPLHCDIINDVTLLPMAGDITGQISVYAQGAFANKQPLYQVRRMIDKDTQYYQLPYVKAWHTSQQEVIYGGIFFMHWGHFLLENLQRLWYAKNCKLPIVWTGVNGFSHTKAQFPTWQSDIFNALGIENEHIFLTEPTKFAKVHFPEPGSGINTHIHPQFADFLGYYEATPIKGKYVYFSRAKIRSCANEEQVENLLKKRGWSIIYPEELSVSQQLKALSTAEVCFMIGGSAQHSLLFTKNLKTRFIIIPREHTATFNIIANLKSDNYFLFNLEKEVLYSDNLDEANDFFTLDIATLENILEKSCDFTNNIEDFSNILVKPTKLIKKHITVPHFYYKPPAPLSKARKLFYIAYFLYQQKKYTEAYKIFAYLRKKHLLDNTMHIDFFNAMQRYQIESGKSITLPLEAYRYHVERLQDDIKKNPQNLRNYKKLNEHFLKAGDFEKALQLQENLIQRNPKWSKPLAKIALIYYLQHRLDKAIEYAQKAMDIEPHKLKRALQLGKYLFENKNYNACKTLMSKILKDNPTCHDAYAKLANVHEAQGALEKAIACIKKAADLAPNNMAVQEQLANYMHQKGEHNLAINIRAKTMQQNPRLAERFAQNARIYAIKGELDKAVEYARKAVEMEPRNFVCKEHLASYLIANKNYTEAMELMTGAMHKNPFWSEPHVQFASMHFAKGEIDKAIDCARKASAVEPFNNALKIALNNYRQKKLNAQLNEEDMVQVLFAKNLPTCKRIQSYIDMFYAKTYLEIGVFHGRTFLNLDVPFKIGVDPEFQFNVADFANEDTVFYSETSDIFFDHFAKRAQKLQHKYHNSPFKFDIIFIDGLHTFEQTLQDFENTLPYSHEKTIWIFDDTVPSSHFSALNCQHKQTEWKTCAGLSRDPSWHGDVFKAIFAIHDKYPEFSSCTQTDNDNPQTILWRTEKPTKRKKVFNKKSLSHMRYEDFVEHAWVMHPVNDAEVFRKIYLNIDPFDYKTGDEYKKVIKPIITDKEKDYAVKNHVLQKNVQELEANLTAFKKEIAELKNTLLVLSKLNNIK